MNGSSNNTYTYKDIQRYHAGEMSAEEMHQLEKAALNDPFLADALEGYKHSLHAEDEINLLKQKIKERSTKKNKVIWIGRNNNWLKVAAIFIFIALGGWFFLISNKSSDKNIAVHQDSTTKANQVTTAGSLPQPIDTTKNYNDSTSVYAYHSTIKKQVHKILNDRKADTNSVALYNRSQPKKEIIKNEVASAPFISNEKIEPVNKNGNLKGNAVPEIRDFQSGAVANANMAARKTNDTIKNLNVTLQPVAPPALSEVVINKKKSFNRAARSNSPQVAVPEHGWASFNEYVQANLNRTANDGIDSTGDVELSFDITDEGKPVNIKVEKSLCSPCDKEAIRLLQDGPKWIKKENYKGKVSIHF